MSKRLDDNTLPLEAEPDYNPKQKTELKAFRSWFMSSGKEKGSAAKSRMMQGSMTEDNHYKGLESFLQTECPGEFEVEETKEYGLMQNKQNPFMGASVDGMALIWNICLLNNIWICTLLCYYKWRLMYFLGFFLTQTLLYPRSRIIPSFMAAV